MLGFEVLPPEITSAKMYTGPGAGPMTAAASAWDALAAELDSFAQSYSSVISALEGQSWTGPAATAMAAAAAPYAQWAASTAAQAEQTASQARGSSAAYETARAAVVPPPVVAANRTQLTHLIATNLLGQNTAQIAATEAQYEQMWAQDVHAMYGYATASSTATQLSPFTEPPQTTNAAAAANAPAAAASAAASAGATHAQTLSQLLSSVPQQLSAAAAPAATSSSTSTLFGVQVPSSLLTSLGNFNTIDGPVSFGAALTRTGANSTAAAVIAFRVFADLAIYSPLTGLSSATSAAPLGGLASAGLAASAAGSVQSATLASVGTAAPMGPLSVPPAWASATPVATASEQPLWLSEGEAMWASDPAANAAGAAPAAGIGPMAGMAGAVAAGMLARPVVNNMLRVAPRRFKMPRPTSGG